MRWIATGHRRRRRRAFIAVETLNCWKRNYEGVGTFEEKKKREGLQLGGFDGVEAVNTFSACWRLAPTSFTAFMSRDGHSRTVAVSRETSTPCLGGFVTWMMDWVRFAIIRRVSVLLCCCAGKGFQLECNCLWFLVCLWFACFRLFVDFVYYFKSILFLNITTSDILSLSAWKVDLIFRIKKLLPILTQSPINQTQAWYLY